MRRILVALIIAFVIQLPFLFLMSRVGVHSVLGGAWVFFYLPAIWILDKIRVPDISPWVTMLSAALVQQIILLIIILPLMALWARLKTRKSTSG